MLKNGLLSQTSDVNIGSYIIEGAHRGGTIPNRLDKAVVIYVYNRLFYGTIPQISYYFFYYSLAHVRTYWASYPLTTSLQYKLSRNSIYTLGFHPQSTAHLKAYLHFLNVIQGQNPCSFHWLMRYTTTYPPKELPNTSKQWRKTRHHFPHNDPSLRLFTQSPYKGGGPGPPDCGDSALSFRGKMAVQWTRRIQIEE